jgi:hypothetical protein
MTAPPGPISRHDIEAKFREIQGEVDVVEHEARSYVTMAVVIGVGVVAVLAFALGRRRGKRRSTWVEIRRV